MEDREMDFNKIKTVEDVKRATLEIPGYTEFDSKVYAATFRIPKGKVSTYGRVAKMIGKPKAYRAVANSLHKNPLFPVVACHRVVKEDGSFGGDRTRAQGRCKHCEEEGVPIDNGKVKMSKDIIF
jgi:methylated-DNA-[protein]-cysteine S-methyltransferase